MNNSTTKPCPDCDGVGTWEDRFLNEHICDTCSGRGYVKETNETAEKL